MIPNGVFDTVCIVSADAFQDATVPGDGPDGRLREIKALNTVSEHVATQQLTKFQKARAPLARTRIS